MEHEAGWLGLPEWVLEIFQADFPITASKPTRRAVSHS